MKTIITKETIPEATIETAKTVHTGPAIAKATLDRTEIREGTELRPEMVTKEVKQKKVVEKY